MEFLHEQPLHLYGVKGCEYLEGRPIVFLRLPPKDYLCPRCGVVLGAAHACQQRYSCGHVLCRPCVVQIDEDGVSGCPLDPGSEVVEALSSYVPTRREARAATLNGLMVYCINRRHGCDFISRLDSLVHHLRYGCRLNEVSCPKCGRFRPHRDLQLHLESGCPARPLRSSAGEAINEAVSTKNGSDGRVERSPDVHERQDVQLGEKVAAANGGGASVRSKDWIVIGSPKETASTASIPTRSEALECNLALKIPASSWYDRPTTAPPTETEAAETVPGSLAMVVDDQVSIDWPVNQDVPTMLEWSAKGSDEAVLRGLSFKVRLFRAELDSSVGERTTKFVVFEILVKKAPGEDVIESNGAGSPLRWEPVSLFLKHPLDDEGFRLQTFNSVPAVRGHRVADQWSKVAVTTPVEWVIVREFVVRDHIDVTIRFP